MRSTNLKLLFFCLVVSLLGGLMTLPLAAQDTIKWSQPPVLYEPPNIYIGWDEPSLEPWWVMVLDDFRCDSDQPVTAIRWWGSFLYWYGDIPPVALPDAFYISIWTDAPASGTGEPMIKWEQMPELSEYGMDVDITEDEWWSGPNPGIAADDFPCEMTGPITDIHIWGSWWRDLLPYGDPANVWFTVSIHANNPMGPYGYSEPVEPPLWIRDFYPGEFYVDIFAGGSIEWYFFPCNWYYDFPGDFTCWQYDFYIDPAEAFIQQEGNIYWLDVQAHVPYGNPEYARFGWKTASWQWNDYATWACGWKYDHGPWNMLEHPQYGDPRDLAFRITTQSEGYSHPNEMIWATYCEEYDVDFYGWEFNPQMGTIDLPKFEFYQQLLPEEYWYQPGDNGIYWLGISALYYAGYTDYPWGWETRPHFFMDDAVRFYYDTFPPPVGIPYPPEYFEPIKLNNETWDLSFELISKEEVPPELEYGDAPEKAIAYPPAGWGMFPTCINAGPAGWIQHNNFGAWFGPSFDFETEGNAGWCPQCFPPYDADECFNDGDAGLIMPEPYTIDPLINVIPCPACNGTALGIVCQTAVWGQDIDIDVHNHMPNVTVGYVNLLVDWDQNGTWGGSSTCPTAAVPEHVLVNFLIPNPYDGPLSGLMPAGSSFLIGPNQGYVWARFSITEVPVPTPISGWNGEGNFEDGETEDYLLRIDPYIYEPKPPVEHLKWSQPPIEWYPQSEEPPVYCGWDEMSVRETEVTIVEFPCWNNTRQCHGDADNSAQSKGSSTFWVYTNDLVILTAAMGGVYPNPPYNHCADFDRNFVINPADVAILQTWYGIAEPPIGPGVPADCPPEAVTEVIEHWQSVADDFRCLGRMPVTSIHWWGSYLGWMEDEPPTGPNEPIGWKIAFWTNIAATADQPSRPNELIWQIDLLADQVEVEWAGLDQMDEGASFESCFQYTMNLEPNDWFWQDDFSDITEDNVFWISITAIYDPYGEPWWYPWGWKTRPMHWMDDAVRLYYQGPLELGVVLDPSNIYPIEGPCGDSFDLAFELDTDPNYIKHEQAYDSIRHWPWYHDEKSMAREYTYVENVTKWSQAPDLTETGIDVDATSDMQLIYPPQILADDFLCTETEWITDIHVYGSWWRDQLPQGNPTQVVFTLSLHPDIPAGVQAPWSMPGPPIWMRPFNPGEFGVEPVAEVPESYYMPCTQIFTPYDHFMVWRYSFHIPEGELLQEGTPENPVIYWLDVQAMPIVPNPEVRFGWKTSPEHWQDNAVFGIGMEPYNGPWEQIINPMTGITDLAFEITAIREQHVFEIDRLVADDWPCEANTPVTAVAWWGSYIGYRYEACQCQGPTAPPTPPDYFLLQIWTDVPAGLDLPYSHPGEVIWEYKAYDYDEVLVGYDKYPLDFEVGYEPVFRYSVRLPDDEWFRQEEPNSVYWLSIVAVYSETDPLYPWGWTNHKKMYNDDAVAGYLDTGDPAPEWIWDELYDQNGVSQDMSFVLFTQPGCFPAGSAYAKQYADFLLYIDNGYDPSCWCNNYGTAGYTGNQCYGDAAGDVHKKGYIVYTNDLLRLSNSWKAQMGDANLDPCADFAHDAHKKGYRVYTSDLGILSTNWKATALPNDCPRTDAEMGL